MEQRYSDRNRQMEWQWQWRGPFADDGRAHAGVIPGIIFVGIGALFLLNNLQIFPLHDLWRYWPAILIAVGMLKLVDSNYTQGRVFGGVLVGAGVVALAHTLGYITIRKQDLWPLILIGVGLLLLFQRTLGGLDRVPRAAAVGGNLAGSAVFSGGKQKITDQDFKGGEISAVFGGYELDLRKAHIQGDSAVLEISAVFGGVEIKIPDNWSVAVEASGIFGGIADETVHPDERMPGYKRLIIRGSAIFGGVEIKN
jgi:hypothetical protein